jgi:hypothetical protein
MHHDLLATRWEGNDLLVLRNDQVADRIAAADIRRVVLVCEHGDTPSDLSFAVIDAGADHVILPAESGIAGRVHFERQPFWTERACIYWVDAARAPLPRALRPGLWLLRRHRPGYLRLPSSEIAPLIEQWPLEGPQTWEQRKWARIAASRSLPPAQKRPLK